MKGFSPTLVGIPWGGGTTPILSSENLGRNLGVQPIPRVALRVAPRIGFSHNLGRECNSESCFENAQEFRELLQEWLFHSESVFSKFGGSQVSEIHMKKFIRLPQNLGRQNLVNAFSQVLRSQKRKTKYVD